MRIDDGIAFRIERDGANGHPVARLAGPAARVTLAGLAIQCMTLPQDGVISAGVALRGADTTEPLYRWSRFCIKRSSYKEHSASPNYTLLTNSDVAICERQATTLFLDVDVGLHPIIDFSGPCKIQGKIGSDEARWRIRRKRQDVAEGHVSQRSKDATMYSTSGVAMLGLGTKSDH
jgi:hypothetical protein